MVKMPPWYDRRTHSPETCAQCSEDLYTGRRNPHVCNPSYTRPATRPAAYPACESYRCRSGALVALFDSDGNHLASTCLRHAGEVIYSHNKRLDRAGANPEDIRVHPLYREAQ